MEFLSKSGLSFFKSLLDLYFATKSYVNKAIASSSGKFWGTFNDLADLQEITGSNGDYAYVIVPDDYSTSYDRYKWQDGQWVYEYTVGGEAFDDAQWAAINSGITSADKARLNQISENIGNNSISEMRSDIDANASEIEGINEELGDIDATLATKANVDGYYESMAVGQADNLKGQVLIPNDAAFRTSGGSEDVDTGLAHLQNIKGNTVSWNSLVRNGNFNDVSYWNAYRGTISASDNILTYTIATPAEAVSIRQENFAKNTGHKFYFKMEVYYPQAARDVYIGCAGYWGVISNVTANVWTSIKGIVEDVGNAPSNNLAIYLRTQNMNAGDTIRLKNVAAFDLTLIYGAGNEPTSVEQFEADYQKWFGKPLTYEPYNAGELIPTKTTALKTTGFNQWDEEWEVGRLNPNTGGATVDANKIRCKNFIDVIPNSSYYINSRLCNIAYYDNNKNYLGRESGFKPNVYNFKTTKDTRYIKFYMDDGYGTTYNHDICINLSWSGTRNGEYEPYESHTLQLPLTTLTGKLNGAGESVVVFPDGVKKAGSVQDDIYISGGKTYAVKRVGSVDLGTLNWKVYGAYSEQYLFFSDELIGKIRRADNTVIHGICANLLSWPNEKLDEMPYKAFRVRNSDGRIYVNDSSSYTASTFKAAMQGVMLYYELATPLIYELDNFTLPQTFKVNDWGTEEQVHAEGVASVPAILNSLYAVNAVDTIRRLPQNYISQESMDNFLAQLGSAMGGTWTKSFNTTTNEWEFAFVQSASLMSVSNNEETNNEEES